MNEVDFLLYRDWDTPSLKSMRNLASPTDAVGFVVRDPNTELAPTPAAASEDNH